MISYNPTNGDANTVKILLLPRTCFIMTKLGSPIPKEVDKIRSRLITSFSKNNIEIIDANSYITGKDFLLKIWDIILAVPLGIAIICSDMSHQTFANIFYEIGLMQALGKEVLIIKTTDIDIPSDFIRTEFIEFPIKFKRNIEKFLNSFFKRAKYYSEVADIVENNPLLSIDYLRRAYLISGDNAYREQAKNILEEASITIEGRAKNSVEMLFLDFCAPGQKSVKVKQVHKGRKVDVGIPPAVMESTISVKPPHFFAGGD